MPRVVASGDAGNVVERAGEIVYDLALALITPLRAHHHHGFHFFLLSHFPVSPGPAAVTRAAPFPLCDFLRGTRLVGNCRNNNLESYAGTVGNAREPAAR